MYLYKSADSKFTLCFSCRCDTTEKLRNSLDYLRSLLNEPTNFKLIYRYAFDFARVSTVENQHLKSFNKWNCLCSKKVYTKCQNWKRKVYRMLDVQWFSVLTHFVASLLQAIL